MRAGLLIGIAAVAVAAGAGQARADDRCVVTPAGRALRLPDGWSVAGDPMFANADVFSRGSVEIFVTPNPASCAEQAANENGLEATRPNMFTHGQYVRFFFFKRDLYEGATACLQQPSGFSHSVKVDLHGAPPDDPELALLTTRIADSWMQPYTCAGDDLVLSQSNAAMPAATPRRGGVGFSYADFALLAGFSHVVDAPPETGQAVTLTARLLALGLAKVFAVDLEGGGGRNLDGGWAYGVGMAAGFGGGGRRRLLAVLGGFTASGISGDRSPTRLGMGPRVLAGLRLRRRMVLSGVLSLAWSGRIEDQPEPMPSEFVDTRWDLGLSVRLTRGPLRFALEGTQAGDAFQVTALVGVGIHPKN